MSEEVEKIEIEKQATETKENFSFKKYAWTQFKKNKPAYNSYKILIALAIIALIAPFIATDQPLYCSYKGVTMFPAFSFSNKCEIKDPQTGATETIQYDIAEWKKLNASTIIFAPVAYAPNKTDYDNANYVSPNGKQVFVNKDGQTVDIPAKFRHWLGTNKAGEDVLSGLLNGTRVSLTIGILSMGIASLLGLILGSLAGYFGDKKLKTSRGSFWTFIIGLVFAYYYAFSVRSYSIVDGFATSSLAMLGQLLISIFIFSISVLLIV